MPDQDIIDQALNILETRLKKPSDYFNKASDTKAYLRLHLSELEYESFRAMFLDAQHGLIAFKELFRGTVDAAAVYPREVVKAAMHFNAVAVIFAHNHPSGMAEPSQADRLITQRLVDAFKLIDVNVLDHIIIGNSEPYSFAEHHLLGQSRLPLG